MDKKDIGKMNLKDGFRYQNFLNTLMTEAEYYLCAEEHLFTTTKKHMRQAANPDAEDLTETVDADNPFDVNGATSSTKRFSKKICLRRERAASHCAFAEWC